MRAGSPGVSPLAGSSVRWKACARVAVVFGHEARDAGAAVAELGPRAAGFGDGHAGAERGDLCGDDDSAKTQVREVLQSYGWPPSAIIDLGGIACARGSEGHVLLWLGLWSVVGSGDFNIMVVR